MWLLQIDEAEGSIQRSLFFKGRRRSAISVHWGNLLVSVMSLHVVPYELLTLCVPDNVDTAPPVATGEGAGNN